MATATLPETKPYRVVGLGAVYRAPREDILPDGTYGVFYQSAVATRGEEIHLDDREAKRLLDLDAIRAAGEPRGYDELGMDELAGEARKRGLTVPSTSADPSKPLREDYLKALEGYDLGADAGAVTAASTPGGTVIITPSGAPVMNPNDPPAGEGYEGEVGDAGANPVHVNEGLVAPRGPYGAGGSSGASYDARGKSPTELAEWIGSAKPNADETVGSAHDDPQAAKALLEAESVATKGDARSTVVKRLESIAGREQ